MSKPEDCGIGFFRNVSKFKPEYGTPHAEKMELWCLHVCFFCWHQKSIINLLCMQMFLTCMHFISFFCIVADTEPSHMRRTWYICCRLPCPSSSVFTELPNHAVNFVCVCYCDYLIKNGLVILSSLMTLLVCARAFTFLSSLDITNRLLAVWRESKRK